MQPESTTDINPAKTILNKILAFWSMSKVILLLLVVSIAIIFTIKEIRREEVVIDLIDVPAILPEQFKGHFPSKEGFTKQLLTRAKTKAQKLSKNFQDDIQANYSLDRLAELRDYKNQCDKLKRGSCFFSQSGISKINKAPLSLTMPEFDPPQLDWEAKETDIVVPGIGLHLRGLRTLLRKEFEVSETHISGEITILDDNKKIRLSLRSDNPKAIELDPIDDANLDEVFRKGGEAFLELISPCTSAAFSYNGGELDLSKSDFRKQIDACLNQPPEVKYYGHLILGLIDYQNDRLENAIKHYDNAIAINEKSADTYFNWGLALLAQSKQYESDGKLKIAKEKRDEAVEKFNEVKEVDPSYIKAYFYLAWLQQEDESKKMATFTQVNDIISGLDPNLQVDAYLSWGNALIDIFNIDKKDSKLKDEAFRKFDEAVKLDDKMGGTDMGAIALVFWGNALLDSGKTEEAIQKYRIATERRRNYAVAFNNWGAALYSQGNFPEAILKYEAAIQAATQKNVKYPDAYYNKGVALLSQNNVDVENLEEASRSFESARKLKPNFVNAVYLYGFTQQKLGKPLDAIRLFEEAVELKVTKSASFYDNWGYAIVSNAVSDQAHVDYPKIVDAIGKYKEAIKEDPTYVYAYYDCGVALHLLGRCDDAINLYQKAIDINKENGFLSDFGLATVAIKQGQWDKQEGKCNFQLPGPAALLATGTAETCLNPQPKQSENTTSRQTDGSSETTLDSQGGIIPAGLIWPLAGGLVVLLTGLLAYFVKQQRNSAAASTLDSKATASYTQPRSGDVSAQRPEPAHVKNFTDKSSKPERRTQVGEQYPPPGPRQAAAILVGVEGTMQNRQFLVDKEVFHIGANSSNDLVIPNDDYVSGNHASLQYEKGGLLIVDLASRNGTFVNEIRVANTPRVLQPGDRIRVGNTTFKV
ncbi:MAG: tetratricopeptide repeat protein, partial [Methylococcaceae bacterium]